MRPSHRLHFSLSLALSLAACAPIAAPPPATYTRLAPPAATAVVLPTLPPTVPASPSAPPSDVPAAEHVADTPTPPPAFQVFDLQLFDAAAGWGVAAVAPAPDASHVLVTRDGGRTWQDRTPSDPAAGRAGFAASAAFLDADHAWVALLDTAYGGASDAPLTVWRTADAGQTWTASVLAQRLDGGEWVEMQFLAPERGWLTVFFPGMAVHGLALYGTVDGGATWAPLGSPIEAGVGDMIEENCYKSRPTFLDDTQGWSTAACENSAYLFFKHTADGGQTWTRAALPSPADTPGLLENACFGTALTEPVFLGPGWGAFSLTCDAAAGADPASWVYVTTDAGAQWQASRLPAAYGYLTWAAPDLGWFLSRATSQAEGAQRLYRTRDGGATWDPLADVEWQGEPVFLDADHGWAAAQTAQGPALLATTDGGRTWTPLTPRLLP